MSETDLIERLAAAVAEHLKPAIPLAVDLWDMAMVAAYFKRDPQVVRQTIACLPSFPKAIRLPTKTRAHPLYNAKEVIEWAQKHREKN
ncbi:hypothetical protein GJ700_12415 [Duganella sp. FT92W]|uniref:DNA-binding protein n=1 Tax=Pseudoduganella rivuli TaxID=2666085 RepID=A0A7X2LT13_9BURK|nr:hypothetical protein [Pseudoduganella rivuli]MRV72513.1 hypothetical protein [Pseudoduganella rivuli]